MKGLAMFFLFLACGEAVRTPAAPTLAMDRIVGSMPALGGPPASVVPDPSLVLRAAQLRRALGDTPAAQERVDDLLGSRPGFRPALLERFDLRAVFP